MSIVALALPGAAVADLFAGSGALGFEALSRGAASVDFVELSTAGLRALRENATVLGADVTIHRGDALRFAERLGAGAYDVVFADPPYRLELAERLAARWIEVPFAPLFTVEHESGAAMPGAPEQRRYGTTTLSFYRN